ncbi:MAG: hypothetical protein OEZ39_14150 [Gammaproteobacteria bacterium]|nr:hypothetical protein [Gammaproteobacteria bacterium]MDH5652994.1 hypothetical protein [Gammaproteobacteria bacterium]
MQENNYIVQFTSPDDHRVMFCIQANNLKNTIIKAIQSYEQSEDCGNTQRDQLQLDIFRETMDDGIPLIFTTTLQ